MFYLYFLAFFICVLIILIIWILEMFVATKLVNKGRTYLSERIHTLLNKLWRSPKKGQSEEEIKDLKAERGAQQLKEEDGEVGPLNQPHVAHGGEGVEPLDQGERRSKVVRVTSNEQVEELDSEVFIYPYNNFK